MSQIYRMKDVVARAGVCSMTVRRWAAAGKFPRPIKLGSNSIGFLSDEIDAWINGRCAERDRAPATRPRLPAQCDAI